MMKKSSEIGRGLSCEDDVKLYQNIGYKISVVYTSHWIFGIKLKNIIVREL
jgi:hypothetical protein